MKEPPKRKSKPLKRSRSAQQSENGHLKSDEKRLSQMAEAQHLAQIGSWDWDLQTNERSWSEELYRLFGLNPKQPALSLESVLGEIVHPDDRELFMSAVQHSIASGEPCSVYYRIVRPDGFERVIHSRGNVILDESGKAVRMFGTAQDITERRRTEDALREAEQKYRYIFENALEGIFQTSPDGSTLTANPALATMLGFSSPKELIANRTNIGAQGYVQPARRAELMKLLNEQGTVQGFEFEAYRRDGTRVWLSESARAVKDAGGKVLYYEGMVEDVTERRRAEEKLKQRESQLAEAQQHAHLGSWSRDMSTNEVVLSDELFRLFGMKPQQAGVNYQAFLDRVHPDDRQRVQTATQTAIKTRQSCSYEFRVVREDGVERILQERILFTIDERTGSVGLFGTTQDITARKRTEARSALFAALARKLSGARTLHDAARIIAQTAMDLFGWDACNLELYDARTDHVSPLLNVDTINGRQVEVTPSIPIRPPTSRSWRILEHGPELILREEPIKFDSDSVPFGDETRPAASIMGVPIKQGDDIVGLFSIQSYGINAYDQMALQDLVALAEHCGEAINRIRAEESFRESEARYRELFENSRDAIYVHDLNGRYVSVNKAAEELSGFKREEILGKHYSNFIAPKHLREARENLCRKLDVPIETTYEAEIVCKNGMRKPVEVNSRMIYKDGAAIGVQGTARDISERKRAQEILQTYSRRLLEAQEIERQKIARELHDEIGQVLTAVRLNLQAIQRSCEVGAVLPRVDESVDIIDEALAQVRELSLELRPSLLDDLGLFAALRWYAERYTSRSGINAAVICNSEIKGIPHEIGTACFRIAQEALTNSARHSNATKATVCVERRNGELRLSIQDNGVGFDSHLLLNGMASSALGLRGMQERALAVSGRLHINSQIGKGTEVIVVVPLQKI